MNKIFEKKLNKNEMKKILLDLSDQEWIEEYNNDNMRCEKWDKDAFIEYYKKMKNKELGYSHRWLTRKINKKERVLDIGCGNGYMAKFLADKGVLDYTGVDVSDKTVAFAKKNVPTAKFLQGFGEKLDVLFNMQPLFDVVICMQVIEHVKDPKKIIEQLFKVCKKGGRIYVSTPIEKHLDDLMHINSFGFYEMEYLFEPYTDHFKIIKMNKRFNLDSKFAKSQELNGKKIKEDIFMVEVINDGSERKER